MILSFCWLTAAHRQTKMHYITGGGERERFKQGTYVLGILEQVVDHELHVILEVLVHQPGLLDEGRRHVESRGGATSACGAKSRVRDNLIR